MLDCEWLQVDVRQRWHCFVKYLFSSSILSPAPSPSLDKLSRFVSSLCPCAQDDIIIEKSHYSFYYSVILRYFRFILLFLTPPSHSPRPFLQTFPNSSFAWPVFNRGPCRSQVRSNKHSLKPILSPFAIPATSYKPSGTTVSNLARDWKALNKLLAKIL